MKQKTFDDISKAPAIIVTLDIIVTLAILFAPPILQWAVDTFVNFITQ